MMIRNRRTGQLTNKLSHSSVTKIKSNHSVAHDTTTKHSTIFLVGMKYCILCLCIITISGYILIMLLQLWFMNQSQGLLVPSNTFTSSVVFLYCWNCIFTDHDRNIVENYPPNHTYTNIGHFNLLEQIPHDTNAFTQGLVMIGTRINTMIGQVGRTEMNASNIHLDIYEGTGMYGSSQLRRLHVRSGRVIQYNELNNTFFGEGIAHYRDRSGHVRLIQLTWKERLAIEYTLGINVGSDIPQNSSTENVKLFDSIDTWKFRTTTNEGWGITYSQLDQIFYVSDGSEYIHIWNPKNKRLVRKFVVWYQRRDMDKASNIYYLNELEWDPSSNTILANVWREDLILRINPKSGFVETIYDLRMLFPKSQRSWNADVLNGIALSYDCSLSDSIVTNDIWVTGKYWPKESAVLEGLMTATCDQLENIVCRVVYCPGWHDPLSILQPRLVKKFDTHVTKYTSEMAPGLGRIGLRI